METTLCHRVSVSVLCLSPCSVCPAGTCFFDSSITAPFLCEVHFVTAHLVEQQICSISKSNNIGISPPWLLACVSTVNQKWVVAQASKQANELTQRTKDHRQQTPASMSDTFMNNVHPSCGADNESVDLAGALALLRSNILDPFGAAHSDNRVDVKDLLKKL